MKHLTFYYIFLLSCSTNKQLALSKAYFRPRAVNEKVEKNLDSCLNFSTRLIFERFSRKEFLKYFKLEIVSANYDYDSIRSLTDTKQLPKSYYVIYNFIYNEDTLGFFRVNLDSLLKLEDYGYYDLIAFKKIIDKQLTITKEEAKQIAISNGLTKQIKVTLGCTKIYPDTTNIDSVIYYWQCMNECQSCPWIDVDAKFGKIIDSGNVSIEY